MHIDKLVTWYWKNKIFKFELPSDCKASISVLFMLSVIPSFYTFSKHVLFDKLAVGK